MIFIIYSFPVSCTQTRVSTNTDVPLPEELMSQLKSTEWKERYQAVTKLEQLIDSDPQSLGPHIVKVKIFIMSILHETIHVACL